MVKTVDCTYAFVTFKSHLRRFYLLVILVSCIINIYCCNRNACIYENSVTVIYVSAILQLHKLSFNLFILAPWNYICITCIERENQPFVALNHHYKNYDNVCMYHINVTYCTTVSIIIIIIDKKRQRYLDGVGLRRRNDCGYTCLKLCQFV